MYLADEVRFLRGAAHESPVVMALLVDHLRSFGELIPHVLMGEVAEWCVAEAVKNPRSMQLRGVLALIDRQLDGGAESVAGDLIPVSFIDALPTGEEKGAVVRTWLDDRWLGVPPWNPPAIEAWLENLAKEPGGEASLEVEMFQQLRDLAACSTELADLVERREPLPVVGTRA